MIDEAGVVGYDGAVNRRYRLFYEETEKKNILPQRSPRSQRKVFFWLLRLMVMKVLMKNRVMIVAG